VEGAAMDLTKCSTAHAVSCPPGPLKL
jgi:hypothetical protein